MRKVTCIETRNHSNGQTNCQSSCPDFYTRLTRQSGNPNGHFCPVEDLEDSNKYKPFQVGIDCLAIKFYLQQTCNVDLCVHLREREREGERDCERETVRAREREGERERKFKSAFLNKQTNKNVHVYFTP